MHDSAKVSAEVAMSADNNIDCGIIAKAGPDSDPSPPTIIASPMVLATALSHNAATKMPENETTMVVITNAGVTAIPNIVRALAAPKKAAIARKVIRHTAEMYCPRVMSFRFDTCAFRVIETSFREKVTKAKTILYDSIWRFE